MPRTPTVAKDTERAVGHAHTVLVAPNASTAFVASVVAVAEKPATQKRLRLAGGAAFAGDVVDHFDDMIIPLVDHVCKALGLPPSDFVVTIVTPDALAVKDLASGLSGESADVAISLALISAALNLPLKQDFAATGRLLSAAGEVGMVSGLAMKAAAVAEHPEIRAFLCPDPYRDHSLEGSAPLELERITGALAQAAAEVRIVRIRTVADALQEACDDEAIVHSALALGFFAPKQAYGPDGPASQMVSFLSESNETRFWNALESDMYAGRRHEIADLLTLICKYHAGCSSYPSGAGARLRHLIRSLPPAIRRLKLRFPLMPAQDCVKVGQFACNPDDHDDLFMLIESNLGKVRPSRKEQPERPEAQPQNNGPVLDGEMAAETLLQELSSESLEREVGWPIDEACLAVRTEHVCVESLDDFRETVTALYTRMRGMSGSLSRDSLERSETEALALVDRAFEREGGFHGAYAEALQPTRLGGMRHVINVMADRLKHEEMTKRVLLLIVRAVDPHSYPEKVAIAGALFARFKPFLPSEIAQRPVEDVACVWETIARAYAQSLDEARRVFKRF